MKRILLALFLLTVILLIYGCDKEKIVTSTEYVHDVEYVELPGDTVYRIDTVTTTDTVIHYDTTNTVTADTILVYDTITVTTTDTLYVNQYIYDTTYVTDTLTQIEILWDTVTVTIIDTVETQECLPYGHFAFAALPFHCDPLVIDFVYSEFGYDDGWIYYLSLAQSTMDNPSLGVYDFCGYIDYWTPDWSGYYPLEYCFRLSFVGDDPADPMDWELQDVPAASGKTGIRLSDERPAVRTGD